MKKLLAIVVLGLLWSGSLQADVFNGKSSNGSQYSFDLGKKIIHETTLVPDDTVGTIILDVYEITELNKTRIIGEISYLQFMNGLGEKAFGGRKKFSKKYKKQIAESKINCECENPIYKNFILDLNEKKAYKVFHPQSKEPKLYDDFRLLYKKNYFKFKRFVKYENQIIIDRALDAALIYSIVNNPQGIFKKSKGSSKVPGSSSPSKSLSSGSGSVLDKKFGEVTLKQLIGASRR